jgi:hypothetical protein
MVNQFKERLKSAHDNIFLLVKDLVEEYKGAEPEFEKLKTRMTYPELNEIRQLSHEAQEIIKELWHIFLGMEMTAIQEMNVPSKKKPAEPKAAAKPQSADAAMATLAKFGIPPELIAALKAKQAKP